MCGENDALFYFIFKHAIRFKQRVPCYFMHGGEYCEPHYSALNGKSHYKFACITYNEQCSETLTRAA